MSGRLHINFINETPDNMEIPAELIAKVLGKAYAARREQGASLNLLVTGDEDIAKMNEQYLGHEGPTDVLAFDDGDEDEEGTLVLGDVAVSADTALRVAVEKNMKFEEELALYALHGMLHLLGMRDHTEELRSEMVKAQKEEFSSHGLNYVE